MKKNSIRYMVPVLCGLMLAGSMPTIAMADTCKIVTIGNDLTDEQKQTMMNYFNVSANQVQIIYVTNDQEQKLLGGKIPAEQIGTHTLSCAYVNPTTSGGIKVRTANLTYVTCNMLASALSTAGVTNAEIVAACPFAVSGTGALTGVMIAYEQATGTELSEEKKDLATKEMVDTGKLGDHTTDNSTGKPIGRDQAIYVVNQAKTEIIKEGITDEAQIRTIVEDILEDEEYTAVEEYLQEIIDLLKQIADQGYNYDDVSDTLESIDENITGEAEAKTESTESSTEENKDTETEKETETEAGKDDTEEDQNSEDSILNDVDESKLGDDVIISDTDDAAIYEETTGGEDTILSGFDGVIEETFNTGDTSGETTDGTKTDPAAADMNTESTENTEAADTTAADTEAADSEAVIQETETEATETEATETMEEKLNALYNQLDDAGKLKYDDLETFCDGEYFGDAEKLTSIMGADFTASAVVRDTDTAEELKDKVLEVYANLLIKGVDNNEIADTTLYQTAELNQLHKELLSVFGLNTDDVDYKAEEDILADYSMEDKQALYNDTMIFFENIYGEGLPEVAEMEEETTGSTEAGTDAESTDAGTDTGADTGFETFTETEAVFQ